MRQDVDANRLLDIAASDPDIDDVDEFRNYLRHEGAEVSARESSTDSGTETESFDLTKAEDQIDYEHLPVRAKKSRPGMNDKLKNIVDNTDDEEVEVYRGDNIKLKTYEKMAADSQIAFGTFLFKGWVSGLPYTIQSPDEHLKNIVDYIVGQVYDEIIRNIVTTGFKFGFAFGEKVWSRENAIISAPNDKGEDEIIYEGPLTMLEKVKFMNPRKTFSYFVDRSDEITRVEQRQRTDDVSVDRSKLLWFSLDKEFSNVFGRSRYKNVYSEWYFSKIVNQWDLNDLQKRGSPHLEIRYPRGKSEVNGELKSNREIAMTIAEDLLSDGIVAVPSELHDQGEYRWEVKFADTKQESGSTGKDSRFARKTQELNRKKMKGLGIPPAVADSDSNFANADASGDMLTILIEDVVDQIESVIQKDIVDQVTENNFGPEKKSLVSIKIDRSALGRRSLMKEIFKEMLRAGTSLKGKTLKAWPDVTSMMDELGISSQSLDKVFTDHDGGMDRRSRDPQSEQEDIEDSNDTSGGQGSDRTSEDDRDRDRASERDDATEDEDQ